MHVSDETYLNDRTSRQLAQIYYIIIAMGSAQELWLGIAGRAFSNIHDSGQNQCLVSWISAFTFSWKLRNHDHGRRTRRRRSDDDSGGDRK